MTSLKNGRFGDPIHRSILVSPQLPGHSEGLVVAGRLLYQQSRTPAPAFSELGQAALPCPHMKEKQLAQPAVMGELSGGKTQKDTQRK